jgi:hypothetical protein
LLRAIVHHASGYALNDAQQPFLHTVYEDVTVRSDQLMWLPLVERIMQQTPFEEAGTPAQRAPVALRVAVGQIDEPHPCGPDHSLDLRKGPDDLAFCTA